MVSGRLGTEGSSPPGVQLPGAKAHQIGRAKRERTSKPLPNTLSDPLLLLSRVTDSSDLLGVAKVLQGGLRGSPGVRGKKSQLPWGDLGLGHFKHLSQGASHSLQGPSPLRTQQGLPTRKEEREPELKAEEGDQQPSKNVSFPIKRLR